MTECQCYVCKNEFARNELYWPEELDGEYGLCKKCAPDYLGYMDQDRRHPDYDGFDDDTIFDVQGRL